MRAPRLVYLYLYYMAQWWAQSFHRPMQRRLRLNCGAIFRMGPVPVHVVFPGPINNPVFECNIAICLSPASSTDVLCCITRSANRVPCRTFMCYEGDSGHRQVQFDGPDEMLMFFAYHQHMPGRACCTLVRIDFSFI